MKLKSSEHALKTSFPFNIDQQNRDKILSVMEGFITTVEAEIAANSDWYVIDSIHRAIVNFHHENKEIVEKKLYPDFDEDEDWANFTQNLTALLMVMKQHWCYNKEFLMCLDAHTDAETGIGDRSLFISALDL